MADGPMSTPRRPWPRSSPAPITAIVRVSRLLTGGNLVRRTRSSPIKVLIADDDDHFLQALKALIEQQPELAVVAEAANGLEAIELADAVSPDAVVIDLHMPLVDGVAAVARPRHGPPSLCLVVLAGAGRPRPRR